MPDITMCQNNRCPSRKKCYRFMAKPNPYWQAYTIFIYDEEAGGCEWHEKWEGKEEADG